MKPYYEGWYMKQQQGEDVLAVIPGRAQDSAFIQVVSNRGSSFLPYPLEAFDRTDGSMRIGDSLFTPYGMQLRIDEPDFELVGSVRYDHLLPLRSDIMGPFAYVPMETKHTVFSMRHQVTGSIRLNGDALDIRNGIGYMEGVSPQLFLDAVPRRSTRRLRHAGHRRNTAGSDPLHRLYRHSRARRDGIPLRHVPGRAHRGAYAHDGGSAAGRYEPAGGGA